MIGKAQNVIWAGGEHPFRFAIGELRALEQRRDCGVGQILVRLTSGTFYVDDVLEVLRLGLMGGGLSDKDARLAIERSYDGANYLGLALAASEILTHFVSWPTGKDVDDPLAGEAQAATAQSPSRSETESDAGPATLAPLQ